MRASDAVKGKLCRAGAGEGAGAGAGADGQDLGRQSACGGATELPQAAPTSRIKVQGCACGRAAGRFHSAARHETGPDEPCVIYRMAMLRRLGTCSGAIDYPSCLTIAMTLAYLPKHGHVDENA